MDTAEDVLTHYGIPGMKWGVRRRKNDSGRLTSTPTTPGTVTTNGKLTVSSNPGGSSSPAMSKKDLGKPLKSKAAKRNLSDDAREFEALKTKVRKKGLSALTNEEVKTLNTRFDMEKKYKTALAEQKKKGPEGRGKKFIKDQLIQQGGVLVPIVLTGVTTAGANRLARTNTVFALLDKLNQNSRGTARAADTVRRTAEAAARAAAEAAARAAAAAGS